MKGFQYCSIDTNFFSDIKIRKLRKKCGMGATEVFLSILCDIYREGYYIAYDEDYRFIIADTIGCEESDVEKIVDECLNVGLFDRKIFSGNGVLTSAGIQERYAMMERNAKRKGAIREYNLLEPRQNSSEETAKIPETFGGNGKNSGKKTV